MSHPIDAVLVIADRDEPFAAATAAIHHNIPLIHVSGGDVSGPSVDHKLRNAITVFSQHHLVQTEQSRRNVIKLGANPGSVHVVGSAGLDGLQTSQLLSKKRLAAQLKLKSAWPWYVVVMHPTPFEKTSLQQQIASVVAAVKKLPPAGEKLIFYPNADTGSKIFIQAILGLKKDPTCHLVKNINHNNYLSLLYRSVALIGNTSSGLMEAGYLKVPFVLIGNRQAGREQGPNVIAVPDYTPAKIIAGINKAKTKSFLKKMKQQPSRYHGGDVSGKIVKAVETFLR